MTGMLEHDGPLYSTLAQDPDLCDIVELFVEEMPSRIAALAGGVNARNWEQVRRTVHQIKGAAGSYGFAPITRSAAQLEALIHRSGPEDEVLQAVDELLGLCRRVRNGVPE